MDSQNKKFVSLLELATELKIPKSTLTYYVKKGLIKRDHTIGKADAFDRVTTLEIIKRIREYREKDKLSIEEIKDKL